MFEIIIILEIVIMSLLIIIVHKMLYTRKIDLPNILKSNKIKKSIVRKKPRVHDDEYVFNKEQEE